jgi:hypothetical protein
MVGRAALEVHSRKLGYRNDYRQMLEDITDQCVELLMELRAPTAMRIAPYPGRTPEIINQRFAFLRALIGSRQFRDALHRITTHPHQRWEPEETTCDIHLLLSDGRDCVVDLETIQITGKVVAREVRDALVWIDRERTFLLNEWMRYNS